MADSNIPITAGSGTPVDTRTQADGDHRQVVVQGDATAAFTQTVRTTGDAMVGFTNVVATGNITAGDSGTSSTTVTAATGVSQYLITGTPTPNSSVTLALDGHASFCIQLTGTFAQALTMERSVDGGTTYFPVAVYPVINTGTTGFVGNGAISSRGLYQGDCSASTNLRIRCTFFTSGTATVRIIASPAQGFSPVHVNNPTLAATTAAKSNVTASTTSVSLASSSTVRSKYAVFNDSSSPLYINEGSSASTTAFVVKVAPGGYWENVYSGSVNGVWDTAVGTARVTTYP